MKLDTKILSKILSNQVYIVKAMVFPVVTYGCESWTIKEAECQRINAFKLWGCRSLLRAPWTARKSNQSILKEISPEYSLEGLMLKLMLQYFGHLMRRADSLGKIPMLGKTESRRRRGWQEDEMTETGIHWCHPLNLWGACCSSWGCKESDTTEQLNNKKFSSRKKGRGLKSIKFEMKKGEVTKDTTETQRIIRVKQLSANYMDNLVEMDKFLEKYNLPRLNQEETENMSRPIKYWNWNCD